MTRLLAAAAIALLAVAGCDRTLEVGQPPPLTPVAMTEEHLAMMSPGLPIETSPVLSPAPIAGASLWTGERGSLLGDRRAMTRGDIMTVVIEIDDSASFNNASGRSRSGGQDLSIDEFLALPQWIDNNGGPNLSPAVGVNSSSSFSGDGSVSRNEQLELRVAATVTEVLPNGVLQIQGRQEVRVNNEVRELLVDGYVRPADITRQNEITYDKIAAARISYGGRGIISDVQRPRWGAEISEVMLPF
ncbi:flagellar basal body L-ring protein FlgH [Pseudoroseicyclus tamaricis]|uniref:Flagellar L-ring protein n=1 Tax=Pseudoroseicyclus tamaricis TaxID=2705421 RepID=A0A6B2JLL2_9RHOB|nr:flagellar basal body L-ring protein FlgH [Pseudoroseicyclus tamaricis]NDU99506.1 flagellar basal body L-ring protein FlgH [Pseudoroseicyclus tamaricis]